MTLELRGAFKGTNYYYNSALSGIINKLKSTVETWLILWTEYNKYIDVWEKILDHGNLNIFKSFYKYK